MLCNSCPTGHMKSQNVRHLPSTRLSPAAMRHLSSTLSNVDLCIGPLPAPSLSKFLGAMQYYLDSLCSKIYGY